ncbi:MAG: phosphoglucomutase/phosphomannomutase family protein [Candidatus Omnitrophica bacterium]|nr:phosphoglucomutase/phosphomannomutase family protein [Candidatus Omnitrophota bacterium]
MANIKFGTSGWRAIISEDFTFENVDFVVQAVADYIKKSGAYDKTGKRVVVGYDTRFLSKEFARQAAAVFSANGIKVLLCDRDTPTPAIAYHIIEKKCCGGINFTASHNPAGYNGIKFSPSTGGPATPDITLIIEKNIKRLQKNKRPITCRPQERLIEEFDPREGYLDRIKSLVDIKAISRSGFKIACDCMYGTSRGYLDKVLGDCGIKTSVLHDYPNPGFGGKRPEPAEENIVDLIGLVRAGSFEIGLATDGDADRVGIVDSDGTYISPNEVIILLLHHFIANRNTKRKTVARTIPTTNMIDRIANRHGIKVIETPVGFKYFVKSILDNDCIIAGEESGGLSISGHVPEKDGILACLLAAEMRAVEKRPISSVLSSIYKEYGRLYYRRMDIGLTQSGKQMLLRRLSSKKITSFAGISITARDTKDGIKFSLKDGSWVLFRPSGTEPIVRIYVESVSTRSLTLLQKAVMGFTGR